MLHKKKIGKKKDLATPKKKNYRKSEKVVFPNLLVSMCANFHEDRSSGLACASDTDTQTDRHTHKYTSENRNQTHIF